jgi:hypothetical protein
MVPQESSIRTFDYQVVDLDKREIVCLAAKLNPIQYAAWGREVCPVIAPDRHVHSAGFLEIAQYCALRKRQDPNVVERDPAAADGHDGKQKSDFSVRPVPEG